MRGRWTDHGKRLWPSGCVWERNTGHDHIRDWWTKVVRSVEKAGTNGATGHGVLASQVLAVRLCCNICTGREPCLLRLCRFHEPAAQNTVTKYKPPPAPAPRISQVHLFTLAFDTYGRWSQDAVSQVRELARRRLSQPDARRCVPWTGMCSRVLQRCRAEGPIALQRRNFGVWHDCIGQSLADGDAELMHRGALVNLLLHRAGLVTSVAPAPAPSVMLASDAAASSPVSDDD